MRVTHFHVLSAIFLLLPTVLVFAPVQTSGFLAITAAITFAAWLLAERCMPGINMALAVPVTLILLYGIVSAFWAIEPVASLQLAVCLCLLSGAGLVLCSIVGALTFEQRQFIARFAFFGTFLAVTLLYIDVLGDGVIQLEILHEERADYGRTASLLALVVWALIAQPEVHTCPILAAGAVVVVFGILLQTPGFAAKVAMLAGLLTLFAAWRFRALFSKIVFALVALAFLLGPTLARTFDQPNYYSSPLIKSAPSDSLVP